MSEEDSKDSKDELATAGGMANIFESNKRTFAAKEPQWLEILNQMGLKCPNGEEENNRFAGDVDTLLERLTVNEMKARLDNAGIDHSRLVQKYVFT